MTLTPAPDVDPATPRFAPQRLAALDEPVRRYFTHAIGEGAPLTAAVRLTMHGRIKVGIWLPFTAEQDCDGHSLIWRARIGWKTVTALTVTDHTFGYLRCGGVVHAERRFGDIVVPSRITVGWRIGTDHFTPFFHAEIDHLTPVA